MKIIIAGLSVTANLLLQILNKEKHQISVIDSDQRKIDDALNKYNVDGYCGSISSSVLLKEASCDIADVFIAITSSDEANILSSVVAKRLGCKKTIVRIDSDLDKESIEFYKKEFNIDLIYNPKTLLARQIANLIDLPASVGIDAFFNFDSAIMRMEITKESILNGKRLTEVKPMFSVPLLIVGVKRGKKVIIPTGQTELLEGDEVAILSTITSMRQIFEALSVNNKPIRNITIVGCGDVGEELLDIITKKSFNITVVESSLERCKLLLNKYPRLTVSCGDGLDEKTMIEEGIRKADCAIALTAQDEKNITISLFSWYCGVQSIITKINSASYSNLLHKVNINRTVSKEEITVDSIIQFLRNIEGEEDATTLSGYSRIYDGEVESSVFTIDDHFSKLGIEFMNPAFKLKPNCLIAGIIRNDEFIIPGGKSKLQINDRVILISMTKDKISSLEKAFLA